MCVGECACVSVCVCVCVHVWRIPILKVWQNVRGSQPAPVGNVHHVLMLSIL